MNSTTLKNIITNAFTQARNDTLYDTRSKRIVNSERSKRFVKNLASEFKSFYSNDHRSRVYLAGDPKEFLHDISVFRVEMVNSPNSLSLLERITDVLWQIESEMAHDADEWLEDLNKLGAGKDESDKLYVCKEVWNIDYANENTNLAKKNFAEIQVKKIAKNQMGRFFVAFIPHPLDWPIEPFHVILKQYDADSDELVLI